MEQMRGPYETLKEDPGDNPSLPLHPTQVAVDLSTTVQGYKSAVNYFNDGKSQELELFDESTTHFIIEEAIDAASRNGRIACITCPSIFCSLQESFPSRKTDHLFDFDPRYSKYGSNVSILGLGEIAQIAPDLQHAFAVIIADVSMLGINDARSVIEIVALLSMPHEPLRLILIASEDLIQGLGVIKQELRLVHLQLRGRWGVSSKRLYTTIPHPRRLL